MGGNSRFRVYSCWVYVMGGNVLLGVPIARTFQKMAWAGGQYPENRPGAFPFEI